jgi:hypothetical protein
LAAGKVRLEQEVAQREEAHALAFLRLETPVRDAALFASTAEELIVRAEEKEKLTERAVWAVLHLAEMVRSLRRQWHAGDADEAST